MFESQKLEAAKKASTQETKRQVSLHDPEYPPSAVFTSKFVVKNGESLLNSHRPSLDPKTACNVLDYIYMNVELTMMADRFDADLEDSCANVMYQVLKIIIIFFFVDNSCN